jgi:hypothetical protein
MTDSDDRYDQLCTKCGVGRYHETSIHDDWDGVLHCTNRACNHEVGRYKFDDNPPPKPKMVKLSPAAQTVLDASLGRDSDRLVIAAALRAAADQIEPEDGIPSEVQRVLDKLRAIADELDGVN